MGSWRNGAKTSSRIPSCTTCRSQSVRIIGMRSRALFFEGVLDRILKLKKDCGFWMRFGGEAPIDYMLFVGGEKGIGWKCAMAMPSTTRYARML